MNYRPIRDVRRAGGSPARRDERCDERCGALDPRCARQTKTPEASAALKRRSNAELSVTAARRHALKRCSAASEEQKRVDTVATRNRPADYQRALARIGTRVRAQVTTAKGSFTIELLPDEAPLTVDNFVVELARRKVFDCQTFHRVVPNFVIQGATLAETATAGPAIKFAVNKQASYERGAVGMALSGKRPGGSPVFVNIHRNRS